ncbi:MAG TPA: Gfo/Idh/MocA family oxidoreductase, partial [Sphingomicrobium sp.]
MNDQISRRGVLGLGVAAAAASAVTKAEAPDRPVGFAVVGLGKLSLGQIIPGFRNCKSARLEALVSGHPDKANRIAAEEKLRGGAVYSYENFDRIAADPRIEVVYIVLPNFMHREYTERALK